MLVLVRSLLIASSVALLAAAASACSSGGDASTPTDSSPDASADATSGRDAGAPPPDPGAGEDAGEPPPIRCTPEELAALDLSGGGELEITFEDGANPRQYTNRCATVKVGATVVFKGSFFQHPLQAAGGDTPSPIPYTASDPPGQTLSVTMSAPGIFGYECEFHPTLMYGAIKVVP